MGILGKKLAFVFPGQGSQAVGMGEDFLKCPASARLFGEAGGALSELCFRGPGELLGRTVNTQPALYLVSCAAFEAVREKAQPIVCAGHSAGEYAALYAAGAFSFSEGLRLIGRRAALMEECAEANPGAMAAVIGLGPEAVTEVCKNVKGVCVPANFNSPLQTVVSGEKAALSEAEPLFKEAGARRVVFLRVSGGFHSPLMNDAAEGLASALEETVFSPCAAPVVSNAEALPETEPEEVKRNLKKQLTGSVRWTESVLKMKEMGAEAFVELGSGSVLAGLIGKTLPDVPVVSIGCMADIDKLGD
ncbi:MAG: ACP S-malonyltransferase [Abditibacteriota bacterium]|nr:ACP S-malonyltransferase [Abditibacteriota bacterium]